MTLFCVFIPSHLPTLACSVDTELELQHACMHVTGARTGDMCGDGMLFQHCGTQSRKGLIAWFPEVAGGVRGFAAAGT
jgi:hypothetical protein